MRIIPSRARSTIVVLEHLTEEMLGEGWEDCRPTPG